MKTLEEKDILKIMKEEWERKVKVLSEDVDLMLKTKVDDKVVNPLDKGLKVMHKKSKIMYSIVSVSPQDVVLRTPEGEEFMINSEELENEYVLDK